MSYNEESYLKLVGAEQAYYRDDHPDKPGLPMQSVKAIGIRLIVFFDGNVAEPIPQTTWFPKSHLEKREDGWYASPWIIQEKEKPDGMLDNINQYRSKRGDEPVNAVMIQLLDPDEPDNPINEMPSQKNYTRDEQEEEDDIPF